MVDLIKALPRQALVLLILAFAVALLDVVFYVFLIVASARKRSRGGAGRTQGQPSIAVILRTGSIREGLETDVEAFLNQSYPRYSVVVVDDSGEADGTPMLDGLRARYANLFVTAAPSDAKFTNVEKLSLTVGVKSADAEWIVQASRHCPPVSDRWLDELSGRFTDGVNVVLGYSRVRPGSNAVSRYAAAQLRWRSFTRLAYARCGLVSLGDHRNLAYRKEAFLSARGFAGFNHLLAGEGELIASRLGKSGQVASEVGLNAQTHGAMQATSRDYFLRRIGEMQVFRVLPFATRWQLERDARLRVLTWAVGFSLLFYGGWLVWVGGGLLACRRLLHLSCGLFGMTRFKERWNVLWIWAQDVLASFVWLVELRKYRLYKQQPQWRR